MHPLSAAYQDWLGTNEGQECQDPAILMNDGQLQYLQNRVYNAWHAGARAQETLDITPASIQFVKRRGLMAECLGVDVVTSARVDEIVGRMINEGASQIAIVEHIRDHAGLNLLQFCAFIYSLGYYCGARGL